MSRPLVTRTAWCGENAVISGHPEAVRLGLEVSGGRERGRRAGDGVAALGVTEPGNSGPGGKLVLMYYDAKTRKVSCMVAPGAAPGSWTSSGRRGCRSSSGSGGGGRCVRRG